MVKRLFLGFLVMVCLPAMAATININVDRNPVALNESLRIIFTVEGSLDDEPDFSPLNKDFHLLGTSQSSQFNMINGSVTRSKTYTLTVAPLRTGNVTIPAISFGRDKSPTHNLTVTAGSNPKPSAKSSSPTASKDLMFITSEVDTDTPYVQQQVILKVKIYRRKQWADVNLSEPDFSHTNVRVQQLGKENVYDTKVKRMTYQVIELRYALFPQLSGELIIKPFQLTAKFAVNGQNQRQRFGNFSNDPFFNNLFSRQTYEKKSAQTKSIKLKVQTIPSEFTGERWLPAKDIQIQQTWSDDTSQLKAGEPVTRTIAIIGDAVGINQIPDITMPELPQIKSYPDQAVTNEQASASGLLSTRTQKLAIIPSRSGTHAIPKIEIPWWNTETDKMQIAQIPASQLIALGQVAVTAPDSSDPAFPPVTTESKLTDDNKPVIALSTSANFNPVLMAAVIIFLLLWLMTLYLLIKQRSVNNAPTGNSKLDHKADLTAALKNVVGVCQSGEANALRDALLRWAKARWPHDTINNLDELATRLPADAAASLSNLSSHLYGKSTEEWDAQVICQAIKSMPAEDKQTHNAHDDTLQPLYR